MVPEGEVAIAGVKSLLVRGEGSGAFLCRHRPLKGAVRLSEGTEGGEGTSFFSGTRGPEGPGIGRFSLAVCGTDSESTWLNLQEFL